MSERLLCPSARPEMPDARVFGVRRELGEVEFIQHLAEPVAVSDEILALAGEVSPGAIFRFSAPCAESQCQHFDGARCGLGAKIAALSRTVDAVPACRIRAACRWFVEQGSAACLRCPLIFSETANPSGDLARAADPTFC